MGGKVFRDTQVTANAHGDTFWNPVSAFQCDAPFGFFRLVLRPFYLNTFQSWLIENSPSLGHTWAADLQMTMWLLM